MIHLKGNILSYMTITCTKFITGMIFLNPNEINENFYPSQLLIKMFFSTTLNTINQIIVFTLFCIQISTASPFYTFYQIKWTSETNATSSLSSPVVKIFLPCMYRKTA